MSEERECDEGCVEGYWSFWLGRRGTTILLFARTFTFALDFHFLIIH